MLKVVCGQNLMIIMFKAKMLVQYILGMECKHVYKLLMHGII